MSEDRHSRELQAIRRNKDAYLDGAQSNAMTPMKNVKLRKGLKRSKSPKENTEQKEVNRTKKDKKLVTETARVQVEDEDQFFEMVAEGQSTDFNSEEEEEGKLDKEGYDSKSMQTESDEETEVFFNNQCNNNANVALFKSDTRHPSPF